MNLIEQFGGYEKVKSIRDINIKEFDGDASGVTIHYKGNSITQEGLEKTLLEYRRQHNIFEIGDKVLEIGDDCEMSILTVNSISSKIMVCVNDGLDTSYCLSKYSPSFYVRHATDEEIKAGADYEKIRI